MSVAALLSTTTHADPDLWGHLRFGLDALRDHHLSAVDPYSFTQDVAWVNHEWLSEVSLAASYRLGGLEGIVALKAAIVSASLTLTWRALRGYGVAMQAAVLLVVAWAALPLANTHRPQLWSWLAVPLVLILLRSTRGRWFVPLVFAAWANLHGGWIVGLGLVAIWAFDTVSSKREWSALGVLTLSAAATLVTPYGVGLWTFLASTVRLGRPDIQEWQPVWTAPVIGVVPYALTWGLLARAAMRRRISWPMALGCAAMGLAAGRVMRLVPFFLQAVAVWTAPAPTAATGPALRAWVAEGVAAVLIVGTVLYVLPTGRLTCLDAIGAWAPDTTIRLHGRGTLLVPFAWGEYALWQWGPGLRVSIDGRRETVYSDAVVRPQLALVQDDTSALPALDRLQPDAVWYPQSTPHVRDWLVSRGYVLAAETAASYVLVKPGAHIGVTTGDAGACFPD